MEGFSFRFRLFVLLWRVAPAWKLLGFVKHGPKLLNILLSYCQRPWNVLGTYNTQFRGLNIFPL